MKKGFELKEWMSDNREQVIEQFEKLSKEKFYNGVTIKQFMIEVLKGMERNNPKSEKRASFFLPMVMGNVHMNNTQVGTTYSAPYSESNHAKQVAYHGADKAAQINNI